jgi:ABC-2 type transport system ATP-binding protein
MAVLAVRDAKKSYGATQALRGVSLELAERERLGLLGPNGAGKTTLVRALAGRLALDAGAVELLGRPLANGGGRGDLGVVPQEIALYPLLTARENLDAFGRLNGVAGAKLRERVAWALEWTALADRAKEPIKRFSGGMKRRLNIACGVLHEPRVILLDEPTVGVDPQSRERIYDMLDGLRAAGASILLTTHQLEEAEARCDRIVVLDHGQVRAAGTLAELVAGTVGNHRQVAIRLERALAAPLAGFDPEADGGLLRARVDDVGCDLPALLGRIAAAGGRILDVEVRAPSLQSVFLHLTGRELRE